MLLNFETDVLNIAHLHRNFNQKFRDKILFFCIRLLSWCVFHTVYFDMFFICLVNILSSFSRISLIFWNIIRFFLCSCDEYCNCRWYTLFSWISRDYHHSVSKFLFLSKRRCRKFFLKCRWSDCCVNYSFDS